MAIIIVMVFMRKLQMNTVGFIEVTVILAFFLYVATWPNAGVGKSHIRMLILLDKLPQRRRALIESVIYLLSMVTCIVMVWACIIYGHKLLLDGSVVSLMVRFPLYILIYLMAFSFLLYGVVLLTDLIDSLTSLKGGK